MSYRQRQWMGAIQPAKAGVGTGTQNFVNIGAISANAAPRTTAGPTVSLITRTGCRIQTTATE